MRPVSDAFLRAVRGSHTMSARARVCETFQTGTDPAGTEIDILAGDVLADAHADIRATLDMTTSGNSMWPINHGDLTLAPYGNEVFLERGLQFGGGSTEWVSLGYYRIEEPDQAVAPDGPIRLLGSDRMAGIVDARLLAPVQFTASQTYGGVLEQLVLEVYPGATIEWDSQSTTVLGRSLLAEEDRFGFLNDLVTSLGKIWYWDHRGILVVKEQPTTSTTVFDVDHGAGGVLVNLARKLTRKGVYNAVVASGEAADTQAPVRAVAIDANPDSPTYFHGRFGPVPRFYSSPLLTSNSQCASAAASLLRKQLGLPYSVDFTAVPNPALEPWDPIGVRYSSRFGTEKHLIERLSIPLTAGGAMTGTTREQTVVLVEVS